ncbi:MAG: lycopene cyclase family protein [Chitinophagaceae bacterium]
MNTDQRYDYIIAGAGCAGLSLLVHMIHSGLLGDKKILLIDREAKQQNDRTWCFWEKNCSLFEPIVYRQWEQTWFHGTGFSSLLQLAPYTYKLIRGIDFYKYCLELICQQCNIDILQVEVEQVYSEANDTYLIAGGRKIHADYIFSSILPARLPLRKNDHSLLQHFKGWVIDTDTPVFHPEQATLMDFRAIQEHGCAFAYVMPFSSTRALVEFTLFTGQLLQPMQYEEGLRLYIHRFITQGPYRIAEEEYGIIPMTSYRFPVHHHRIVYIGTAGGQTRASSGYTFRFIQKHSAAIVASLLRSGQPFVPAPPRRFHFYDRVLLDILHNRNEKGKRIFSELFRKNKPQQVLRFLDNESSPGQELGLIASLPARPFLQAALRQLR